MATRADKDAVVKTLHTALDQGVNLSGTTITVPPHASGQCGIDTTRLYGRLPQNDQHQHTQHIQAVTTLESARSARRSDVIARFVRSVTPLIRVDTDTHTNVVTFTVNFIPSSVLRRKRELLLTAVRTLLEVVTTVPIIGRLPPG